MNPAEPIPADASVAAIRAAPAQCHDIVVVGASAGGVEALSDLVERLPPDLPAAVFVVLHVSAAAPSLLPAILNRASALPAVVAEDRGPVEPGKIYVAPPDSHLLVAPGEMRLWRGPPEHACRPAVDPMFRTAAASYGPRVLGVVLSGTLDDGVAGLAAVKRRGGIGLVQSPEEAQFASMPSTAIATLDVDHVLTVRGIAAQLDELARTPIPATDEPFVPRTPAELVLAEGADGEPDWAPVTLDLRCPDCGGLVSEVEGQDPVEFACPEGHRFSSEGLLSRQGDQLELALWETVRRLEERASLLAGLAARARSLNAPRTAERFEEQANDNLQRVRFVRRTVLASAIEDLGPGALASPNDS